jgi:predicted enzyme related to lactoylglutathione lyase
MASSPVIHFEIPADDPERAHAFYREAFGWQIDAMPGMGYALVSTTAAGPTGRPAAAGEINGGMLRRQEPITAPVITIGVDDIDATLPQIEKLGGTVVRGKTPVGTMGFSAYFTDPEGNVLGLWEAVQA